MLYKKLETFENSRRQGPQLRSESKKASSQKLEADSLWQTIKIPNFH
jgi:hypothetical protein